VSRVLVWLLSAMLLATSVGAEPWRKVAPGHIWSFPGDHHAMPEYRSEWWYLTGQLTARGESEPTHGVQVTIFRLGLTPDSPPWRSDWASRDLVLGHLAVTDLRRGEHLFSEVLTRTGPGRGGFPDAADSVLAWVRAPAGGPGRWSIRRQGTGFAVRAHDAGQGLLVDLQLRPERELVFQGPGGVSEKDPEAGAGSLYYSYPRLAATGQLAAGADTVQVTGNTWFDREVFTSQLASRHAGWDWMGLQLDDGRDLMAFALRDTAGQVDVTHVTLVEADGAVRWLRPGPDFLVPLEWWISENTGVRYPVAWRLDLPDVGLELELSALVQDQENVGRRSGIVYWEGAVVGRSTAGVNCRGYVELTGYGGGALPF